MARLIRHGLVAGAILAASLVIGMVGYAVLAGLNWVDAFLNAAMILGGMGPINPLDNDAAKIFAGVYALYSGLVILAAAGIVITPVVHRVLHSFHVHRPGEASDLAATQERAA